MLVHPLHALEAFLPVPLKLLPDLKAHADILFFVLAEPHLGHGTTFPDPITSCSNSSPHFSHSNS